MKHFSLNLLKGGVIFHIEKVEDTGEGDESRKNEFALNRPRLIGSCKR